jgi:site-specific recombinase XerD
MAHLRKKGRHYYAEFYDPCRRPRRKWVALRTTDKQAAQSKMVELDREFGRGEFDPWEDRTPQAGVTVTKALDGYVKARGHLRKDTIATDRAVLDQLVASLPPGCLVEQVEPRHVRAFVNAPKKNKEPRSAATRSVYLARIKTFFAWCEGQRLRKGKNPTAKIKPPKVGQKVPLSLSRDEYGRLLTQIETDAGTKGKVTKAEKRREILWLADAVRITVGTGLRVSELCHLHWSAVDLQGRRLVVKASKGFAPKSYHERTVPLAGEALETLRRMNEERPSKADTFVLSGRATRKGTEEYLDRQYVNKRFKHYAKLAGLDAAHTFHSLRRTYASWLVQGGTDLYRVQRLLGHADLKTTMRYAFLAPDNLKADVERVFGLIDSGVSGDRAANAVEFEVSQ